MRWIFIALAGLNLLLLGYFLTSVESEQPPLEEDIQLESPEKRLILLSEANELDLRSTSDQFTSLSTECFKLGPFDVENRYRMAESRAAALGVEIGEIIETVPSEKPVEFWVYVPPRKTRTEAEKVLGELKRRKVDSFLIGKGELENSISLGLFRVKASANRIANQVRKYGVPVEIEVKNEDSALRWLEVRVGPGLTDTMRGQIRGNSVGTSWSSQTCQSI